MKNVFQINDGFAQINDGFRRVASTGFGLYPCGPRRVRQVFTVFLKELNMVS